MFSGLIVIVDMWMIFVWVPTEINQGSIQRILYLHVPLAWGSMAAICIVAFSSIIYLKIDSQWYHDLFPCLQSDQILPTHQIILKFYPLKK